MGRVLPEIMVSYAAVVVSMVAPEEVLKVNVAEVCMGIPMVSRYVVSWTM